MIKLKLLVWRIKDKFLRIGKKWDALAWDEAEAEMLAHEHINKEPKKLIHPNVYSFEHVLAHNGEQINARFRKGQIVDSDIEIAKMVGSHSADCDLVLYRGVCRPVLEQMLKNGRHVRGANLVEKSFLQCSLVKGHELNSEYHLRIFAPKGTPLVYLGGVNDEPEFFEVDIQRGSILKIVSADEKYINCTIVGNM